ncbi:DUF5908 family protein [Dyadobacter sp. LJ53]|uniref:DUF5908 family protein n=1 Tax=Dyadobacter chenwenxiniae TaxID=2906456 RepID=UPI001F256690|nr:DUF5908 family protein [Dyadobacter chenwenxiniae]MCF0048661.1 DUF5908 family protein [Dyadobacter chenwenxiniae]
MPVVINEVVIRATVTERLPGCGDPKAPGPGADPEAGSSGGASSEQIAEQIFEILKAKRER